MPLVYMCSDFGVTPAVQGVPIPPGWFSLPRAWNAVTHEPLASTTQAILSSSQQLRSTNYYSLSLV